MNNAAKQRLSNYKNWVITSEMNGVNLIPYNCPSCLEKLKTIESPTGEIWDTFSNCPFCQSLLFKVTQGKSVKVDLITKIGQH